GGVAEARDEGGAGGDAEQRQRGDLQTQFAERQYCAAGTFRLAPRGESGRFDAGASFLGDDGEIFAEINARPQLVDGPLTVVDNAGRRRGEQPARQRVFSDVRPRRGEQLEERAFAEQVEILGVRMRGVDVAFAG